MQYFILTATLLALALSAGAQQLGIQHATISSASQNKPRPGGRISGMVVDDATQQPVSYASVGVLDADGKAVSGGVADTNGKFVLGGVPAGSYTLEISFLGYTNERRTGVVVVANAPTELGQIALAPAARALGEVLVVTQKPLIEERVDRTIYNAENDQTARGGDATDVLKRVPLLSVDLDGNVSLRGNQNIRVLINNKPSTIAANSIADALKQIPADQIKTVEVITSPSAKYDAEGSGGIINIITKDRAGLQGVTLGLDASVGLRASNLGLSGSYRKGKLGLSLGGFGRAGYNIPGEFDNVQAARSPTTGAATTTTQQAATRQQQAFGRYTLGFDYDLSEHNALTGSVAYGTRRQRNHQDGLLTQTFAGFGKTDPGAVLSTSLRDAYVNDVSGTVDASLNFTHTFARPQHELSVLTLFSRNDRTNTFTNSIFNQTDGRVSGRIQNENPSYNEEYTAQVDYQNPVAKTQILELGAKNILRRVSSDYATLRAAGADGPFLTVPGLGLSNQFNYRQNVMAAYLAYTLGLPKGFTLKPGLRYEHTTISADFADVTPVPIPDYGVLVPSANLSRKLGNGNTLKLAYNRRIQRPSLQFLNPNVQAANPLNVTQGNPRLAPEYTNNYELGYSTAIKRVNLNLSTFVRNTTGAIQAVRTVRGADTIRTTFDNIGQENAYGGSAFANASSAKFSLSGGVDAFYAVLRNNVPDVVFNANNQGFVVSGRVFGSYNFTPVWGLQAFVFYRGRQVQLQGDQSGFGVYSLSVKRDFAEKRGSIGLGAENFFNASGITIHNTVSSPLIEQSSRNLLRNLSFKINFSYRIGKLTATDTRGGKGVKNDDLKEGGEAEGGGAGGPGGGGGTGGPGGGARQAGGARPGGGRPTEVPGSTPAGSPARNPRVAAPTPGIPAPTPVPATPADSTALPQRRPRPLAPADTTAPAPVPSRP